MTTPPVSATIQEQAAGIRLLVLDVDGVMTDGGLYYDADGRETKVFNVKDGYGIKAVAAIGITVAVISGRRCKAVEMRTAELDIKYVSLSQDDKLAALNAIVEQLNVPMEAVAFVGDDVPDLPILIAAGLGIAVADAHPDVLAAADWCTRLNGGKGAVREVCDLLIAARASGP
jgi:3-deoxy-D-manno-octulosonate 8-phosphate phosphatase (KDO 8-P phosphatase)